jgi:hypothetical protein
VVHPPLRPGAVVALEVHIVSADGFDLEVQLDALPATLRLADGSTRHAHVGGRPAWKLRFAGRRPETKAFRVVLAVSPDATPGTRVCLRLRQVASNGGVRDVVELPVCATVRAAAS